MKMKLLRAIKHDYMLLGCVIFFVFSVVGVGFTEATTVGISVFLYVGVGFFVLGLIRYLVLRSYFKNSMTVTGVIEDVWFMKDRGRVTYKYSIDGNTYVKGSAIMKTKETRDFYKGLSVTLIVKEHNPKKAIIQSLYC